MEQFVSYITLGVNDIDNSRYFYENCLNLTRVKSPPGVNFFSLGQTRLAIWSCASLAAAGGLTPDRSGFPGFCLSHNVHSQHEVDDLLFRVTSFGANVTKAAHLTDWGGYVGYFTDPDGFLWEIVYNPKFSKT